MTINMIHTYTCLHSTKENKYYSTLKRLPETVDETFLLTSDLGITDDTCRATILQS